MQTAAEARQERRHPERREAISVERVTKRYGRTLALDAVTLSVEAGALFGVLGPNGAGKTTLMHILATIIKPDEGSARVQGIDVLADPRGARRGIGVVFQQPSLDDRLTVTENLVFHGLVYGVPAALRRQRIEELLAVVELRAVRDALVRTLSPGMKRRLEIARALVHDSGILILDEPTVGLDVQSRRAIWGFIGELRRERDLTVVVTTHAIEEAEVCDAVCIVDQGRIIAHGTPADLKAQHGTRLFRAKPADEDAAAAILGAFGARAQRSGQDIVIETAGEERFDTMLQQYGARIRQLTVEEPSLESVFLTLTGREIRDAAASARERTFEFGKRGGEHTR